MLAGVEGDVEQNLKETPSHHEISRQNKKTKERLCFMIFLPHISPHTFPSPYQPPYHGITFFAFERRHNVQEHSIREGRRNIFSV
jgi:hypothetical protein